MHHRLQELHFFVAPSFIFTKKGFVSVFVIKQAEIEWLPAKAAPAIDVMASVELKSSLFIVFSQKVIVCNA